MSFFARFALPRHKADSRLLFACIGVICIGALTHVALFLCYRSAMRTYYDISTSHPSQLAFSQLRGDPFISRLSSTLIGSPCEFDSQASCSTGSESSAVANLSKQQLDFATRQLLSAHAYASAYDLAEALFAQGHNAEAITLLGNDVFDEGDAPPVERANFVNRWLLVPAFEYVGHNRDYDALTLFKMYLSVMRRPLAAGHWLSLPGIDATDLPAIVDTFCDSSDQLGKDECILSVLRIAASNSTQFEADPRETDYSTTDVPDDAPLRAFDALPAYLKSDPLRAYLGVWAWDGFSPPEPSHGQMSISQTDAWNYAFAVRLLAPGQRATDCAARVSRSRDILASVSSDTSNSVFTLPALHRIQYIDLHRDALCEDAHHADERSN